ncbi:DUF523 domain-containing protein [Clostridium luticellarii]|uniref:DUF523 domain-containing protein n=1 Tax=Clostridium luticellarii TaxID=1691940 RepID=UPI0023567F59|nr:hypothetical protein [Clostridium luticellarii]MCI1945161.1 hypothetical protein [Clostridium luticellarii]MCI1968550.1 hypothetical protein [Clostridium luticellarii]MCI2041147.1 hypothetical protein [Clostridium luticellarii]
MEACIYDGTFKGTKKLGPGKTAELLRENGIKVFGEDQLDEAEKEIKKLTQLLDSICIV